MKFDETYFKTLNYTNYFEREIRYQKMAVELSNYLMKHDISKSNSLIDYGCALGFLVKGFRSLGYKCEGYDISEWAKQEAMKYGVKFVPFLNSKFDVMFAFDVFEHMLDDDIKLALTTFNPLWILIRIPCSVDGINFHLEISKRDPTHINCKIKQKWLDFFNKNGYFPIEKLDLYTIYDTDGVMCYVLKKYEL